MIYFEKDQIAQAKEIVQRFKKEKTKTDVFYNLCFCILVPQTKFKTVLSVINRLKDERFYARPMYREELLKIISSIRFKNRKVEYLLAAKYKFDEFHKKLNLMLESERDTRAIRAFVVREIKGVGLKAASHFLRNLGIEDLAIVDTHIIKFLELEQRSFNYFKIEDEIRDRASKLNVSVAVFELLFGVMGLA
jgi:N-glycosylase/DNA lyase